MHKQPYVIYGAQTSHKELGDRVWDLAEQLEGTGVEMFRGESPEIYIGISLSKGAGGHAADPANVKLDIPLDSWRAGVVAQMVNEVLDRPAELAYWFIETIG